MIDLGGARPPRALAPLRTKTYEIEEKTTPQPKSVLTRGLRDAMVYVYAGLAFAGLRLG